MVSYRIFKDDKLVADCAGAACFANLKTGFTDITHVTYYPKFAYAIDEKKASKFMYLMSLIGFEDNLQNTDGKWEYKIDIISPRPMFQDKIIRFWIFANLVMCRTLEEGSPIVELFLRLHDQFSTSKYGDIWFLFHIANIFSNVPNTNHMLICRPSDYRPFNEIMGNIQKMDKWTENHVGFPSIWNNFCKGGQDYYNYNTIPGDDLEKYSKLPYKDPENKRLGRIDTLPKDPEEVVKIFELLK